MKKVTILDIAEKAGVSKATVSMVLNKRDKSISGDTRNRILKIAKDMNYIPNSLARSLNTKKTETIGIIVPDITNPFFSEMARAIEDVASILGYNVIFCNSDNEIKKENKYVKLLISKLVDGVIFIPGGKSIDNLQILINNNVPFVLVDRYVEGYEKFYGVYCLNKLGITKAVDYLVTNGRKRIAFVRGPHSVETSTQRLEGYEETMKKYGLFNEKLIFENEFTIEGGIETTKEILDMREQVDSIIYSSDIMAFGGIKVLVKRGCRIPQDISVIGYDNIEMSKFIEPELTTVSQPIYEMGKCACELLINIINGKTMEKKQIYFEPELIVRGTS
ncbi:MAG: LacI family DNA-binding transcriptional regulator [Solirubrobacterales bacterium]